MSLPPWKQALFERRKKQEEQQKKKRAEEHAQLASLPPWKRALLLKQREKKEKEAPKEVTVERSDSFSKWRSQTQKKNEESRPPWVKKAAPDVPRTGGSSSASGRSYSVGSKAATPASSSATSKTQAQRRSSSSRRESVTVVPDSKDTPVLLAFRRTTSPDPGSPSLVRSLGPVSLRKKKQEPVNIKDKRRSFEDHEDPKFASMPAWKKALILRRKAVETSKQENEEKARRDALEEKEKTSQAAAESEHAKQESKVTVQQPQRSDYEQRTISSVPQSKPEQKPDTAAVQRENKPSQSRVAEAHDTTTTSQERPRTSSTPTTRTRGSFSTTAPKKSTAPPRPASRPAPKPPASKALKTPPTSSAPKIAPTSTAPKISPTSSAPKISPTSSAPKISPTSTAPKISPTSTAPKISPTSSAPKTSTAPKTSSTASQKATHTTKFTISSRSQPKPEIVNRKQTESVSSNKLVEQEGVTLHAPVFKEVDQWANVSKDDPKFKNLPSWKQALILRRRADIAKRTGSTSSTDSGASSPLQSPTEERHVKTAWSPRNSFDEAKVPLWKQEILKKKQSTGDSGMGTNHRPPKQDSSKQDSSKQPKDSSSSNTRSPIKGGNVKALLGRFNQGGSEPSTFVANKPPNFSRPSAPSRHTLQLASLASRKESSSDSSDEELEEIPLTSIDEVSTEEEDDDDSGISAGGSAPQTGSPKHSHPATGTPVLISYHTRRKPSTLSNPDNKPPKGLRKVSFSDSELCVEHVYPKYDYSDYEDIDHDKEEVGWSETDGRETNENSGLSHKLHPSLRPTETNNADLYGYSSPSPTKPDSYRYSSPSSNSPNQHSSFDNDLQHYTPSALSGYGDALQRHLSGNLSSPVHSGREDASPTSDVSDDIVPATEDQTSDFYATLNSDAAAMLW